MILEISIKVQPSCGGSYPILGFDFSSILTGPSSALVQDYLSFDNNEELLIFCS